jgi:hypothetical protein
VDLAGSTEIRIVKRVWVIPKHTLQCFTLPPITYLQPLPLPNFFYASNFSSHATQILGLKTWPVFFEGTSCLQLQFGRQQEEISHSFKLLVHIYQITYHVWMTVLFKFATTRSHTSVQVTGLVHLLLSIYVGIAFVELDRLFSLLIHTLSVGILGRRISPSQSCYLHTGQDKHRINAHRHPCLEWDSHTRSQRLSERRQFMP